MSEFISKAMLTWYDQYARSLPWRVKAPTIPDPYHVWLSEIMLQQTTVVTVGPYFEKFVRQWPTVSDLAAADLDEVLTAWAGLGYYARARNLHKCANEIASDYTGQFPENEADLLSLPGIGPYTAAAITAIAFDQPSVVVDGNIERVITRLFRLRTALPKVKPEIYSLAAELTPASRAGDYCQSLMDLGAGICTPKSPNCVACPLQSHCQAFKVGDMELFPVKGPKKIKPTRQAHVFWIRNSEGHILMRRREEKGLLGGMMEFPSSDWQQDAVDKQQALKTLDSFFDATELRHSSDYEVVKHTFTHFHLRLFPIFIDAAGKQRLGADMVWVDPVEFPKFALPTLMKKVVKAIENESLLTG
jgi:A/G-specific adenine glycosylase